VLAIAVGDLSRACIGRDQKRRNTGAGSQRRTICERTAEIQ
jgi:hypothetical protein